MHYPCFVNDKTINSRCGGGPCVRRECNELYVPRAGPNFNRGPVTEKRHRARPPRYFSEIDSVPSHSGGGGSVANAAILDR